MKARWPGFLLFAVLLVLWEFASAFELRRSGCRCRG